MSNPSTLQKKLQKLKDEGLVFSDCVAVFGVNRDQNEYASYANARHGTDDLEIDCETVLSESDTGCWVMAWIYVSNSEIGIEDEDEAA